MDFSTWRCMQNFILSLYIFSRHLAAAAPVGCDSSVCRNGGTCTLDSDGSIVCACPLGYDGERCENTWFSKEVLTGLEAKAESLTKDIQLIQRITLFQDNEILAVNNNYDTLRAQIAELNGPRFFSFWSTLEQSGVEDLRHLRIGERDIVAVLTSSMEVLVYEITGSSFALLQTLPGANILGMTTFSINETLHCVAVAHGSSALFCWNAVSQSFDKIQDIHTREAVSVEVLVVAGRHFLVFPCNGSDDRISSSIFVWVSGQFFLYQYLPTVGAMRASFAATRTNTVIVMSQWSSPSTSEVFSWNGTYFSHVQSFDSSNAFLFSVGNHIFAASSSVLHRYLPSSNTFVEHSVLPGLHNSTVKTYEYFHVNTEHYLVISSSKLSATTTPSSGAVTVHKLNGLDFVPYQTLQLPLGGVTKVRGFEDASGRSVLALTGAGESVSFYNWVSHFSSP